MTLEELKSEIRKYQYIEDDGPIVILLASIVATRLEIGKPSWVILIGQSSGGKSQILRPLALTDEKFMHEIDDLTENTFMSGMQSKDTEMSLLKRIGSRGIIIISDFTLIMSKSSDTRSSILSQLRMVYDGRMTKHSGNQGRPIAWQGKLGMIAASTPSIYSHFEEVADMGERFIYYRMREYDTDKAMDVAYTRDLQDEKLDTRLAELYETYLHEVVIANRDKSNRIELPKEAYDRLKIIATLAERLRTTAKFEWKGEDINRIPVVASPVRVFNELVALARGLHIMKGSLGDAEIDMLEWCGYSLANDEKRAVLKVLAGLPFNTYAPTTTIADRIGLSTKITGTILQVLAATKIVDRTGDSGNLQWRIKDESEWKLLRKLENIIHDNVIEHRTLSNEEEQEMNNVSNEVFEHWGAESERTEHNI